ncbi:hypothetical protein PHMEG_00023040 [Phytophthora megakarya]|uniref:Uncharacterized protein n=1 Tax=Phytophthora megakarya TaxID=4795 RepID=A0A225VI02_9STRA|nr:hypothetical protein PHMEG_00023040 [Phytophthora megakarya]
MKKGATTYPNSLGGDINGQIEVPPLAMGSGSATMNFFKLHYRYGESNALHRFMVWAHPELLMPAVPTHTALHRWYLPLCPPPASSMRGGHASWMLCTSIFHPFLGMESHCLPKAFPLHIVATDHHFEAEPFTCDYEEALIAAIRDHTPNSVINGFSFNLKQVNRNQKETKIAMERRAVDMLTVISVMQVVTLGIAIMKGYIQRRCAEEDIQYLAGRIRHAVINRTYNPLDGFNRELNAALPKPHPNQPTFIATLDRISSTRFQFLRDVVTGRARAPL